MQKVIVDRKYGKKINGRYHYGDLILEGQVYIVVPLVVDNLIVTGNLVACENLIVRKNVDVSGDFIAADVKVQAENISVGGDLHVGNIECLGNLTVLGNITAQNIYTHYNLTCHRNITVRGAIEGETVIAAETLNATSVRAGMIRTSRLSPLKDLICAHVVTYPPIIVTREIDVIGGIYPPAEDILTNKRYY